jgi:hypothetical protein
MPCLLLKADKKISKLEAFQEKMSAISANPFIISNCISPRRRIVSRFCHDPISFGKFTSYPQLTISHFCFKRKTLAFSRPSGESGLAVEDEWLKKLPDKTKPLYAHSIPCIEAWLKNLGFYQSKDDVSVWIIEKVDWHAQLSLDVTDLCIRYLKSGPGNLGKDVERRFSYALSREDIENAILGGP